MQIRQLFPLLLWAVPALTLAAEATVAVAANFAAPAAQLVQAFATRSGHQLRLSSASTGKLYAQISHGAPFDLLLAADQQTPQRLIDDGLAVADSRFTYALGTLVLWSADAALIANGDGEQILKQGNFRHLAIANPELAPYGRAAEQTLQTLGLSGALRSKLVMGESIAQTHQFVASGNAELGLLAYSQVVTEGRLSSGSWWLVPSSLYQPLAQDAVILQRGAGNPAVSAFITYLKSAEALTLMANYGYNPATEVKDAGAR